MDVRYASVLATSTLVGAVVWFATGTAVSVGSGWPYFLVLMVLSSAALSASWGRDEDGFLVVVGLIGTQVVLAGFTADRRDNDGLWIGIFPLLVGLGLLLMILAGLAVWARRQYETTHPD